MVTPPPKGLRRAGSILRGRLTRQFITRNRRLAFVLSVAVIVIAIAAVHVSVWWFSPGVMILPILAGGLLLWPRALRIFFAVVAAAVAYDVVKGKAGAGIVATIVLTAVFADILSRTREKLGVKGLRGDRMLLELRDRIRAQAKLPELGEGWGSSVVLKPAGGSSFGGDFVVSACDGKTLEVALVDVSGKGIDAGTRALLLSGAFGGLLGSVPRDEFLPACNAYLRRGKAPEGFVTAVHLSLELASGEYVIASAGHPPAVRFEANTGQWRVSGARGIVLGVIPDLARSIIAETGLDMSRFPTAAHLVSWAKLCPRTIQSGPVTRGGKTGKGNPYLKGALGEAAAAAAKTDTFLGERYRRIVKRRGKLKALVAVARSILVIVWQLLSDPSARFHDLGSDYHTSRINIERRMRNHIAQLAALGYRVTVEPAA